MINAQGLLELCCAYLRRDRVAAECVQALPHSCHGGCRCCSCASVRPVCSSQRLLLLSYRMHQRPFRRRVEVVLLISSTDRQARQVNAWRSAHALHRTSEHPNHHVGRTHGFSALSIKVSRECSLMSMHAMPAPMKHHLIEHTLGVFGGALKFCSWSWRTATTCGAARNKRHTQTDQGREITP